MEDLERSSERESESVRASVHRIRQSEKEITKKFPFGKRTTFWDADDCKALMIDAKAVMKTKFDQSIILTGIEGFKDEYLMTFTPEDIVSMQFCSEPVLKAMFMANDVFRKEGGIKFDSCTGGEADNVRSYCKKLDEVILAEAFILRDQCVKKIFEKMHKEMGGDMISKEDRVGKRVKFLSDISELYNADKKKWSPVLGKIGLLKRA